GTLLHQAGDAEQVLTPVGSAQARPDRVVGTAGSGDGEVDVRRVGAGDLGDQRLIGRRDGLERCSVAVDELPADEEPVALLEIEDCLRLWGRGVFEKTHVITFSRW